MNDKDVEKIIKANMMVQMNLAGIREDFKKKLQRQWVRLTDEEQQAAYDTWQQKDDGWGSFYALIEAKLKQKNGYAEEKNT